MVIPIEPTCRDAFIVSDEFAVARRAVHGLRLPCLGSDELPIWVTHVLPEKHSNPWRKVEPTRHLWPPGRHLNSAALQACQTSEE
jgi:hypothetical protein